MTPVAEGSAIAPERFGARLAAAGERLTDLGLGALLVGIGPDLRYLTGYQAMPLERLTMLVLTPRGRPTLVVPRLERAPARLSPAASGGFAEVVAWDETEDPYSTVAALATSGSDGPSPARAAVSDTLWATHLLRLAAVLPGVAFEPGSTVTSALRVVKDADEVSLLRRAAQAADRVMAAVMAGPLVARSEREIAREVRDRLVDEGHEEPDFAIVASGPNSASPHHEASDRVVSPGEPVVFDIGGRLGGYSSDTTRTIWVTGGDRGRGPDDEFRRIFDLVRAAYEAARRAALPGTPAERVDAAARAVIDEGRYGGAFLHRTGHGIGLEGHEEPYLVAGNAMPLRPGMAFSIEPGIYLEDRYGVRLEDIVVATDGTPDVLNRMPLELAVVDG